MQVFNRHVSGKGLTVFGFEIVLISGSIARGGAAARVARRGARALWKIVLVTALCELCFYYNDLYDLTLVHSQARAGRAPAAGGRRGGDRAGRRVVARCPPLTSATASSSRRCGCCSSPSRLWRLAFNGLTRDPHLEERVLIVGTGPIARRWRGRSTRSTTSPTASSASSTTSSGRRRGRPTCRARHARPTSARLVAAHQVDRIVVGLSDRRGQLPIEELLRAKLSGVRVEDAATTYERITGKILLDDLKPSWLIFSDGFRASRATRW